MEQGDGPLVEGLTRAHIEKAKQTVSRALGDGLGDGR